MITKYKYVSDFEIYFLPIFLAVCNFVSNVDPTYNELY